MAKFIRKKRVFRKKRVYKRTNRRYNRKLLIGNPKQKVFYYKRHVNLEYIKAPADGLDVLQVRLAQFDDIPAYTEFSSLYDFYKICGVKYRFLPAYTQSVNTNNVGIFGTTSSVSQLRIFTVIDYNNGNAPASIDAMREYQNCKVTPYNRGHTRYCVPKLIVEAEGDSANIQMFARKNPWVNTSAPSINHYGIKIGIDTSLLDAGHIAPDDVLLRIEATYYIAFKNPK